MREGAMKVLISGAGTSDPVRSDRDGALLHIIRHYRPDKVVLLLTNEIREFEEKDHRFELMQHFVETHWEHYRFDLIKVPIELIDPSDLDQCSVVIGQAFERILPQYADDNILYNLSSGTPQMKMVLAMDVLDTRYHVTGIQVKNPEKKAGTTGRVGQDYPVAESLELNEDESEETENRCVEPELFYLRRKRQEDRIAALLARYDYAAITNISEINQRLSALVHHLDSRSSLDDVKAHRDADAAKTQNKDLFNLYPYTKTGCKTVSKEYCQLVEYFLVLKNLLRHADHMDFVLRMNPFMVRLETMYLSRLVPYKMTDLFEQSRGRYWICRERFERIDPERSRLVDEKMRSDGKDSYKDGGELNQYFLHFLLQTFEQVPEKLYSLFEKTLELNQKKRNPAAHELTLVTDEDIKEICGLSGHGLIMGLEDALQTIFPEGSDKIFTIYDRCNRYILEHLN